MSNELNTLVKAVVSETFSGQPAVDGGVVIPVKLETEADNDLFLELVLSVASSSALGALLEKRLIRLCGRGGNSQGSAPVSPKAPAAAAAPASRAQPRSKQEKRWERKKPVAKPAGAPARKGNVITERVIGAVEADEITVPKNAVVTPLAREMARKRGITIRRENT